MCIRVRESGREGAFVSLSACVCVCKCACAFAHPIVCAMNERSFPFILVPLSSICRVLFLEEIVTNYFSPSKFFVVVVDILPESIATTNTATLAFLMIITLKATSLMDKRERSRRRISHSWWTNKLAKKI